MLASKRVGRALRARRPRPTGPGSIDAMADAGGGEEPPDPIPTRRPRTNWTIVAEGLSEAEAEEHGESLLTTCAPF